MPVDEMFDVLPQDPAWGHAIARDAFVEVIKMVL
jgi:hypothetical protein